MRGDLFVSIHFNAEARGRSARGIETYCLTPSGASSTASTRALSPYLVGNRNDSRNMLLAYCVQRGLSGATNAPDRGVRRARFYVLQYAQCPAVLIECGFLSNPAEATQIAAEVYRERIATGIAQGIIAYKRILER
jgi:N-acetylmuramoyl-L-alanine amidase